MAYSKVERHTWNDEKFRRWGHETRAVWFYLLTGKHQNRLGMFVLDPLTIAADVQVSPDAARFALERFQAEGRIVWDATTRLVLIVRHFKHNQPENPNVAVAAAKELDEQPFVKGLWKGLLEAVERYAPMTTAAGQPFCSVIADEIRRKLDDCALDETRVLSDNNLNPFERVRPTLPEGFSSCARGGVGNPEQEPEQEPLPEQEPKKTSARVDAKKTAPTGGVVDNSTEGEFATFWARYPRRAGSNPKQRARRAWNARIAGGTDPADMAAGLDRYLTYLKAVGKLGTEYVLQAATFLGPEERFREPWEVPPPRGVPNGSQAAGIRNEQPQSGGPRTNRMTSTDGRDLDAEKRAKEVAEREAVARWAKDHPAAANTIRAEIEGEIARDMGGGMIGPETLRTIAESKYRSKVLQRLQPAMAAKQGVA